MNTSILSRNLLLIKQLTQIVPVLLAEGIPVIALKGMALIITYPPLMHQRYMDDIDLLVPPGTLSRVRQLLSQHGYQPVSHDPHAFNHPSQPAALDIDDTIWYLNTRELASLWQNKRPTEYDNIFTPPADELIIHVMAHAAVHHARRDVVWKNDLQAMTDMMNTGMDLKQHITQKLSRYGFSAAFDSYYEVPSTSGGEDHRIQEFIYTNASHIPTPYRGHLLRFLLLPAAKKSAYLWRTLFPSDDFIRFRYNAQSNTAVYCCRIIRPVLLLIKVFMGILIMICERFFRQKQVAETL